MIKFDARVCTSLEESTNREWLETNGLGGFASSTVACLGTRRYHALLVAALGSPARRAVLLSKVEETLVVGGERFALSANRYAPDVIHPRGFECLQTFARAPFPRWKYLAGGFEIEKKLFMVDGENTTVVRYSVTDTRAAQQSNASDVFLEIRLLISFRDYHHLRHRHDRISFDIVAPATQSFSIKSTQSELPTLHVAHNADEVEMTGVWYENFLYAEERARGYDFVEDLFNPCVLRFRLQSGDCCDLIASLDERQIAEAAQLEASETARRAEIIEPFTECDEVVREMVGSAAQFIVKRDDSQSIIAGYHWFTDWGRDAMISFTGLTLATRRFHIAEQILRLFAAHLRRGLIPNCFPDNATEPAYNTVDATLWFAHAVGEYTRRAPASETQTREFLFTKLKEIVEWHERGTDYGIRMDERDGLLRAGQAGEQLTWMDAKTGERVVTPREGKPVEVQALWYNALRTTARLAMEFEDAQTATRLNEIALQARESFNRLFWNEREGCLFDCVDDAGVPDASIRPNQIFAISLPHQILKDNKRARAVIETVERELLTPYGLRTLSPRDARYQGRYEGDLKSRDEAYHQGTVWAWLIGAYVTARLKTYGRTPETIAHARATLRPLREHLLDKGVGQIAEIFDGDYPHTPRGCVAQAWSVAEVLRCEIEEIAASVR